MNDKFLKLIPWAFGILILFNLVLIDFIWISDRGKKESISISQPRIAAPTAIPTTIFSTEDVCGLTCQKTIKEKVAEAISGIPISTTISTITPAPASTTSTIGKVLYIPITSSGSTAVMGWTDIAGSDFYFDLTDYPNVKSVRFEANLYSVNGAGMVYVRLYDVTNKRGVDYSELYTEFSTATLLRSADLKIWSGNNLHRVQLKSLNGAQASLGTARLKIIF